MADPTKTLRDFSLQTRRFAVTLYFSTYRRARLSRDPQQGSAYRRLGNNSALKFSASPEAGSSEHIPRRLIEEESEKY
jgi:hypothetical protein